MNPPLFPSFRVSLKQTLLPLYSLLILLFFESLGIAGINSGSDGHDGIFAPTTNTVIDMTDHPDGIYHYTTVSIPKGVTVTFIPNEKNAPVIWLVQTKCVIDGLIDLSATKEFPNANTEVVGGPGGFRGGNSGAFAGNGQGPGGGKSGACGGNASFGTFGDQVEGQSLKGQIYGNAFLLPLLGGSGGGGGSDATGTGGGGGAILIAAGESITMSGTINSRGGNAYTYYQGSELRGNGAGSGGAVRLMSQVVSGQGSINVNGGIVLGSYSIFNFAGNGRVRLDVLENHFTGSVIGSFSQGFQPVIIPSVGQGAQLSIASIGGSSVSSSPSGILAKPDATISGQQINPIPVEVHCSNIPLNTSITVIVRPANGPSISAVGKNSTGTASSSTATILMNMPRGGGLIYATATSTQ